MAFVVLTELAAVDRLGDLGLQVAMVERAVRRADAEVNTCSPLDPPLVQGLIRWGRTTRFLREELVVAGWGFDNPRNLARTIHPDREFAIVVAHGDEGTGRPAQVPTTKHAKGDATIHAVSVNEQLTLDLHSLGFPIEAGSLEVDELLTWFLLFRVDDDGFRTELSLPDAIVEGRITSWAERIILPLFPRVEAPIEVRPGRRRLAEAEATAADEEIVVQVSRR